MVRSSGRDNGDPAVRHFAGRVVQGRADAEGAARSKLPSVTALLQQCCSPGQSTSGGGGTSFGAIGFGSVSDNVLRPGEHITALRIRKTKPDEAMLSRFSAALPDITFRACYCSVLGECWTGNMETLAQIAVRSCPAVLHSFTYDDRRNP